MPKHFISGHYVIREIACVRCQQSLGWKYIEAHQEDNVFKVNHFVLESVFTKKILAIRGNTDHVVRLKLKLLQLQS